jgi:hypothetical protein
MFFRGTLVMVPLVFILLIILFEVPGPSLILAYLLCLPFLCRSIAVASSKETH